MQINIEKKHFYGILGFIILITSGIIIYASVDTSQAWHDSDSIQITINGEQMSLQQAIENEEILTEFSESDPEWNSEKEDYLTSEGDPVWESEKEDYARKDYVNNRIVSPACTLCKSCGGSWPVNSGHYISYAQLNGDYGYSRGTSCSGSLQNINARTKIYLCCA
ncbi:MAG: hypothetical protein ACOC3Z_01820 [Nanoarchaeota archaeon]